MGEAREEKIMSPPSESKSRSISTSESESESSHGSPFWLLVAVYFWYHASIGCITPFLGMYLGQNLPDDSLGMVQSIRPICALISAPLWGRLADWSGRTRSVLILTLTISVLSRSMLWFAVNSMPLLIACQVTTAIFYAPVKPLLNSVVLSSLSKTSKKQYFSLQMWNCFGTGLSSILSTTLLERTNLGVRLIFPFHFILSIPALIFISMLQPSKITKKLPKNNETPTNDNENTSVSILFQKLGFRVIHFFSLIFVCGIGMGILEAFAYVHAQKVYEGHDGLGKALVVSRLCISTAGVFTAWFAGKVLGRFRSEHILLAMLIVFAVSAQLYAMVSPDFSVALWAGDLLRGGGFNLFWSTATIHAYRICPLGYQSTMLSLTEGIFRGIGHTGGTAFGGMLAQKMGGWASTFRIVSKFLMVSVMVLAATIPLNREHIKTI